MTRISRFLLTGVVVSMFVYTYAQESYGLDTITVATSLIPMRSSETGRNITIIDHEQLAALPHASWDELLQNVPGLEIQSRNGFGAQADILLRGSTFTQVLILIDGMRLNDPLTGHFNGNIPLPLSEVERIEVLRGPAAAMYGPDAVGGVVHFITKSWENPYGRGLETPGKMSFGQHGLFNINQGLAFSQEDWAISASYDHTKSKGELIPARSIDGLTTLDAYRNYFEVKTMGLSAAHQPTKNLSFNLRSTYDSRDFSARYFYTNSPFDKSTEVTQSWWNQARVRYVGKRSSTEFNVALRSNKDRFVFSPEFPSTNSHLTRLSQFQLSHYIYLGNDWLLRVGGQLDRRSIESNDRGDHDDQHLGFFATSAWQPTHRFSLTLSSRLDRDDNYGWQFTPQINASLQLGPFLIRGTVGRTIRAADYTERYVSNNLLDLTPGRSLGNPDLQAEQAWSEEIGLEFDANRHWSFKTTFFARQSRDLIDYVPTLSGDIKNNSNLQVNQQYFFAQNIAEVNTQGVELEIWHRQRFGHRNKVQLGVGYTLLQTENSADITSVYLANHAKHLLTWNYALVMGRWEVGVTGLFKARDARFSEAIRVALKPNYMIMGGQLKFRVRHHATLQIQVNNILDEQYSNILGAPMPGRWIMVGASWDLSR